MWESKSRAALGGKYSSPYPQRMEKMCWNGGASGLLLASIVRRRKKTWTLAEGKAQSRGGSSIQCFIWSASSWDTKIGGKLWPSGSLQIVEEEDWRRGSTPSNMADAVSLWGEMMKLTRGMRKSTTEGRQLKQNAIWDEIQGRVEAEWGTCGQLSAESWQGCTPIVENTLRRNVPFGKLSRKYLQKYSMIHRVDEDGKDGRRETKKLKMFASGFSSSIVTWPLTLCQKSSVSFPGLKERWWPHNCLLVWLKAWPLKSSEIAMVTQGMQGSAQLLPSQQSHQAVHVVQSSGLKGGEEVLCKHFSHGTAVHLSTGGPCPLLCGIAGL